MNRNSLRQSAPLCGSLPRRSDRLGRSKPLWRFFGYFLAMGIGLPLDELSFLSDILGITGGLQGPVWGAESIQAKTSLDSASPEASPPGAGKPPQGAPSPAAIEGQSPKTASAPVLAARLIDQEPFDRIFLDAANDHAVLEVFPLDLPGRQVPAKHTQPLIVRLLNRPDTQYEVAWSAVVRIEFFEQRVLQEAQQYVQQRRFDEAYEYFQYLYQHYPKMAGLEEAYQEALWQEASSWYRQSQYDRSLAVLRTLWERNKDRPQLDQAMGTAVEKLVEQYVSAEDYESARVLLRQLAGWYPQHETAAKWEDRFRTAAAALQAQAKAALEKGALREASESARKMMRVWPTLPGGGELLREVQRQYPRVVVGVSLPLRVAAGERPAASGSGQKVDSGPQNAASAQQHLSSASGTPGAFLSLPTSSSHRSVRNSLGKREHTASFADAVWLADMADWSARRTRRLLDRQWMELVSPGSEGGQYRSPVVSFRIEELGRRLVFQIRPKIFDAQGEEVTGYRLSELLVNLANPRWPLYRPEWADRVVSISVQDIYTVEVTLRRAHVRPEAFFRLPIAGLRGPYQLGAVQGNMNIFILNPNYFALSPSQPKEIVEWAFEKPGQALIALRDGQLDVLDRVPPAELDRLRQSKELLIGQYAIPLVHVLVPNMNRPLPAHPRFRRALEYGIPREAILRQICGGKELPGFRVLSAAIPPGAAHDDPIGYAYDRNQKVRPYHPQLALALAKVAWAEVSGTTQVLLDSPSAPPKTDLLPSEAVPGPGTSSQPAQPEASSRPQQTGQPSQTPPKEKPSEPRQPLPEKKRPADPFAPEGSDSPPPKAEKIPPANLQADPFSEETSGGPLEPWTMGEGQTSALAEDTFAESPTQEKPPESPRAENPKSTIVPTPRQPTTIGSGLLSPGNSPAASAQPTSSAEKPTTSESGLRSAEKSLAGVSRAEKPASPTAGTPEKSLPDEGLAMPPLILVHPPTEPARTACRAIRRALRLAGIPVQLREAHPSEWRGPTPPEFDLAYLELAVEEPVADLPRLLGDAGSPGRNSPFLAVNLAELHQAPGWREVRQALYRIHQTTVQELPFVPLWQTVEYFAYRKSLQGIGDKPVLLYENVEDWQIAPERAPSASAKSPGQ